MYTGVCQMQCSGMDVRTCGQCISLEGCGWCFERVRPTTDLCLENTAHYTYMLQYSSLAGNSIHEMLCSCSNTSNLHTWFMLHDVFRGNSLASTITTYTLLIYFTTYTIHVCKSIHLNVWRNH